MYYENEHFSRNDLKRLAERTGCRLIQVSSTSTQNLLHGYHPIGHNCGVYGWNWDAFYIGGHIIICTGRRNLVGEYDTRIVELDSMIRDKVITQGAALDMIIEDFREVEQ